jgi:general secretion pathway protein A
VPAPVEVAAVEAEAPRPLPLVHTPPPTQARAIRAAYDAPLVSEPVPTAVPEPEPAPVVAEAEPIAPEPAPDERELHARIATLEARVDEQDVALRRVLTLLVDWAESEQAPSFGAPTGS